MPTLNKQSVVMFIFTALILSACSLEQTGADRNARQDITKEAQQAPKEPTVAAIAAEPTPKVLEPWEAWEYETMELPMGGLMKFAGIVSTNTLEFDFPYRGKQRGLLTLREKDGQVETIVQIEKGQIQCQSFRPCLVMVRLNEEPAQQYEAFGPTDNSSTSIFIDSKSLPEKIAQAQRVRVQIPVFQQGEPVLEFNNPGLNKTLWLDSTVGKRR